MEVTPALKTVLKRLKLSGVLPTLPDRIAYARQSKLSELQFLELALQDEIDRRDQHNLTQRLTRAGFEESRPSKRSTGTPRSPSIAIGSATSSASASSSARKT